MPHLVAVYILAWYHILIANKPEICDIISKETYSGTSPWPFIRVCKFLFHPDILIFWSGDISWVVSKMVKIIIRLNCVCTWKWKTSKLMSQSQGQIWSF